MVKGKVLLVFMQVKIISPFFPLSHIATLPEQQVSYTRMVHARGFLCPFLTIFRRFSPFGMLTLYIYIYLELERAALYFILGRFSLGRRDYQSGNRPI